MQYRNYVQLNRTSIQLGTVYNQLESSILTSLRHSNARSARPKYPETRRLRASDHVQSKFESRPRHRVQQLQ